MKLQRNKKCKKYSIERKIEKIDFTAERYRLYELNRIY
jgi:hypothetical protein